MDCQALVQHITDFKLDKCPHGNQGYSRILLQLFGYTGHGKSSFINSCKYALNDEAYTVYAEVARSDEKPETMIRKAYKLTDTITLVDNRGCVKMNTDETAAIYAQLGNFLPLDTEVKWQSKYKDMMEIVLNAEDSDQSPDLIIPVFIYSAKKVIIPEDVNELEEILQKARIITGMVPTVVITNMLSEHLSDIQEMFRRVGVENILAVENYTEKDNRKTRRKHEGILRCLYEIVKDVEFWMEERRDPVTEKERKRILLEFSHERIVEKVEERGIIDRIMREKLEGLLEKRPVRHHLMLVAIEK